jgi:hypothetical protein
MKLMILEKIRVICTCSSSPRAASVFGLSAQKASVKKSQKPGAGKKTSRQIWESGDTGLYQRTRSKSVRTKIQKKRAT